LRAVARVGEHRSDRFVANGFRAHAEFFGDVLNFEKGLVNRGDLRLQIEQFFVTPGENRDFSRFSDIRSG